MLYLKVDDGTKATFEAEGCGPFVYQGKGRPIAMSYWRMPDRLLDDHEEMAAWAAGALAVARQGAAAKSEAAPRAGKASAGPPRSTPGRKR